MTFLCLIIIFKGREKILFKEKIKEQILNILECKEGMECKKHFITKD
jgi:hypothetical protein